MIRKHWALNLINRRTILLVSLGMMLASCAVKEQEPGLLGTWNYRVDEAPFGFQSGKVVFYQENDSTKAKIKFYGFTIAATDLKINGDEISLVVPIEHEQTSIKLTPGNNMLTGTVKFSDGSMPIVLTKKGQRKERTDSRKQKNLNAGGHNSASFRAIQNYLAQTEKDSNGVDYRVHTFYYGWYGNPENNGGYSAWNSAVFPHWIDTTWNHAEPYTGGDDIGANYYPQLGSYSSTDPATINTHMQQIKEAGIGVVVISWWGSDHYTDKSVQTLLDKAQQSGLKIAFHIEPFYNTIEGLRTQLAYISDNYLQHPAIYKPAGKPLYYCYNPFQLDYRQWDSILNPDNTESIRDTKLDGYFISLWTTQFDGEFAVRSGFDGIYTYFASDGFAYGSTTTNWPGMSDFARKYNLVYIPCVGPGYIDTRIRPWNGKSIKERSTGQYYEQMFEKAVKTDPDFIGITSFNEWHEGTQIEPAVPKTIASYTYEDYGKDTDPSFYIIKTRELIRTLLQD